MSSRIILMTSLLLMNKLWASCAGVGCSCSVSANAFSFGTYDLNATSANTNTSNVQVTCSAVVAGLNVSYQIQLSTGAGTFTSRILSQSTNQLIYNLYTDSGYSLIWGDGSGTTQTVSDAYILNVLSATRNYTVYGKIPASQTVPSGSYTDNITATLIY